MADDLLGAQNVFRTYQTPEGPVYEVNNNKVSKEEFDNAMRQSDQSMGIKRDSTGKRVRPSMEERRKALESDDVFKLKQGGKAKMPKSKVSTHQKSKKSPAW